MFEFLIDVLACSVLIRLFWGYCKFLNRSRKRRQAKEAREEARLQRELESVRNGKSRTYKYHKKSRVHNKLKKVISNVIERKLDAVLEKQKAKKDDAIPMQPSGNVIPFRKVK